MRNGNDYRNINSGALFGNKKTSPKSADMVGRITIAEDVLQYILDEVNNGANEVTIDVSSWRNVAQSGQNYYKIRCYVPRPQEDRPSYNQGYNRGNAAPQQRRAAPQQGYGAPQQRYSRPQQQEFPGDNQRRGFNQPDDIPFDDEIPFGD